MPHGNLDAYTFYADLLAEASVPRRGIHSQTLSDKRSCPEHTAARPAIIHFLSGDGELTVGSDTYPAARGSWLRMASGTRHAINATTDLVFALYLLPR